MLQSSKKFDLLFNQAVIVFCVHNTCSVYSAHFREHIGYWQATLSELAAACGLPKDTVKRLVGQLKQDDLLTVFAHEKERAYSVSRVQVTEVVLSLQLMATLYHQYHEDSGFNYLWARRRDDYGRESKLIDLTGHHAQYLANRGLLV